MNYLAHIYLSGEDDQLKIGNFIADAVKGKNFIDFPDRIQKGIILHRAIDTYTDSHKIFKKSVSRLFPVYSHYSTVIVDILYDHFLAANWEKFSSTPLPQYVSDFYQLLEKNLGELPVTVREFFPYMVRDNWLLNYATIEGIGKILSQMNQRTKNRSKMNLAVKELEIFYKEFQEEFLVFFEDLEKFTQTYINRI